MQAAKMMAKADPTTAAFTKSSQKGTMAIECMMVVEPGEPCAGERVKWTGYFSERTKERTVESMKYLGCTFPGGKITDLTGLGSIAAQIDVEQEMNQHGQPKGYRVAWVNDPNAGGQRVEGDDLASFEAEMSLVVGLVKSNAARAAAPTNPSVPRDVGF